MAQETDSLVKKGDLTPFELIKSQEVSNSNERASKRNDEVSVLSNKCKLYNQKRITFLNRKYVSNLFWFNNIFTSRTIRSTSV